MTDTVVLGFEIGTGNEAAVEITHMVCTGITNQSGKTTLIEGAASRAENYKFLVFETKPHEQSFSNSSKVQAFFRERADWEYVAGILEASRNEKMKFERYWIMRASKGADDLEQVDKNCQELMEKKSEGSLEYSMYYQLHEYFKKLLPELRTAPLGKGFPELQQGINVMDLGRMSKGVQMLVIESCLAYVLEKCKRTIVVIPELWKFCPEGKRSPIKEHLNELIRQGAAGHNFVWFDSQDMAGVDKEPLKQCYTWVLGLQTERNEIKHTLDQINLPKKVKPTADQISSLGRGHFYLSTPRAVKEVYAWPVWLPEEEAELVAQGKLSVEDIGHRAPKQEEENDQEMERVRELENEVKGLRSEVATLKGILEQTSRRELSEEKAHPGHLTPKTVERVEKQIQESTQKVQTLELEHSALAVQITDDNSEPTKMNTKNQLGQIMYVMVNDFEGKLSTKEEISNTLDEHGWHQDSVSLDPNVAKLTQKGLLIKGRVASGNAWRTPKLVKLEVKKE